MSIQHNIAWPAHVDDMDTPVTNLDELISTNKPTLSRDEVAHLFGVHPRTISKAVNAGNIPTLPHLGRNFAIPTMWVREQLMVPAS